MAEAEAVETVFLMAAVQEAQAAAEQGQIVMVPLVQMDLIVEQMEFLILAQAEGLTHLEMLLEEVLALVDQD